MATSPWQHRHAGPFAGRTLLFVHGTFSNASNMLDEFMATPAGQRFIEDAMSGAKKYDRIVFFEHATLSVSPIVNALELGRAFAARPAPSMSSPTAGMA